MSSPGSHAVRARSLAPALVAAALVLLAIWQAVSAARGGAGVPPDADWERAAAHVERERAPDELIAFAPEWLDPVGRLHLGHLIPIDMAARMDAAGYPAIWEIAARGARAPATRGLEPASEVQFGGLRVRRYEQAPAEVATDFLEAFARAETGGAWARRPDVVLEEVGFSPKRCIRAVPRPGGAVTIRFDEVELGERLVGYAGLADVFTRRDIREPGRLSVSIDGDEAASLEVGIDDGWVRFRADTEPRAGAVVEFEASASAPERLICFAAEART